MPSSGTFTLIDDNDDDTKTSWPKFHQQIFFKVHQFWIQLLGSRGCSGLLEPNTDLSCRPGSEFSQLLVLGRSSIIAKNFDDFPP